MHHTPHDKTTSTYIRKVLEYIQLNLSGDLSLEKIATIANYSPFHFHRVFTEFVGETPKQYIIRLRLERSAHYLKMFPNLSISELADKSGFASHSTFSRAFKNFFDVSANEYRKFSESDFSKIGKEYSKKGKTSQPNTPDLWHRDFTMEETMDWKNKADISVKKVQKTKVIYLNTCLETSDSVSLAFRKLCQWAEPRGLLMTETQYIGMLLDIPFITTVEKCRYWAGITFPAHINLPKDVSTNEIPTGIYANYRISGNLFATVKSLTFFSHSWLANSGYTLKDILGYEIYSENPANKPSEIIEREILIPIRPA